MSALLKKTKEETGNLEKRHGAIDHLRHEGVLDVTERCTKEVLSASGPRAPELQENSWS